MSIHESCYAVPGSIAATTHCEASSYASLYRQSVTDPQTFWAKQAARFLTWITPWKTVLEGDFAKGQSHWFTGAMLNASVNCLDRHCASHPDKTALIWEGDEGESRLYSYAELLTEVCRMANVLRQLHVAAGDRVCLYLPMIPEAVIAMLACARLGAVHTVVFAGFSPQALRDRIQDVDCRLVITADGSMRGGKTHALKAEVDRALETCPRVSTVLVVQHQGQSIAWHEGRDHWYHELAQQAADWCDPVARRAEDPLFILYTSGSTGKPKGIRHATAGYCVYAATTFYYVFDYQATDIFWCTADVGWITGHSYLVYGPLSQGATVVMFAGVPHYPDASRFWQIVDKHRVTVFYTAPTAIRSLMRAGDDFVTTTDRSSLRLLGSVGEPLNPEVWEWYHRVVGAGRCPIVDTWWQTETGGILLSPLPGAMPLKPGSVGKPFFGVQPQVVDETGSEVATGKSGKLVLKAPWPGILQTIHGDHERLQMTYFQAFPGNYFSGDGARVDDEGYYWISGRVDDVINVAGHRLGTAELENALLEHPDVAEAAVVGMPHPIKGQAIVAFVSLRTGSVASERLAEQLRQTVREWVGAIAVPEQICWAPQLPKTRSGKILRRVLRKIVNHETEDLGDVSTLADPTVVQRIIADYQQSNR